MKLDENLAAVHAYLCADGYVVKNPENQKHKYYRVGFRNTNLVLLKDFQEKFEKVFGVKPRLVEGQRCEKGSKNIYELLTKIFGSFYSWEWKMPELNKELSKTWLKVYFDCEGWVFCKTHQNRHIGADCVNEIGISQVIESLNKLGIKTIKKLNKKRNIHRVLIYGKENLIKFQKEVGFLHPDKSKKLKEVIEDYIEYKWAFPDKDLECKEYIKKILIKKIKIKGKVLRMFSKEKVNLDNLNDLLNKIYHIKSLVYKRTNGAGNIYYELDINKKEEVKKLINLKIVPNIFKE